MSLLPIYSHLTNPSGMIQIPNMFGMLLAKFVTGHVLYNNWEANLFKPPIYAYILQLATYEMLFAFQSN